jgi:hypothetical protein
MYGGGYCRFIAMEDGDTKRKRFFRQEFCVLCRVDSKALSAGGDPFSYFRTSALCVSYNYVLHTPEYCTSSTGRISVFQLSHLQKDELKFGGINSNGLTNELSSSFLFSQKLLTFLYFVPTYHKYLGSTYEKTSK